jgi:hypothetical protein
LVSFKISVWMNHTDNSTSTDIYRNLGVGQIIIWSFASIAFFITLLIFCFTCLLHIIKLKKPLRQFFFISIVLLIPVYSLSALASLFYPPLIIWSEQGRRIYESFVCFVYINIIIMFLGGYSNVVQNFDNIEKIKCCRLCHLKPSKWSLMIAYFGVAQYLFCNIVIAMLVITCYYLGIYKNSTKINFEETFIYLKVFSVLTKIVKLIFVLIFSLQW